MSADGTALATVLDSPRGIVERVWSVRPVIDTGAWKKVRGYQAAVYRRHRRRDGLPVWKLERDIGERHWYDAGRSNELGRTASDAVTLALADGREFERVEDIPYEANVRDGGVALQLEDVITRRELVEHELVERTRYAILLTEGRGVSGRRFRVAVGYKGGNRWTFRRLIGTVSRKQLDEVGNFATRERLAWKWIVSMPRTEGKAVKLA